MTSHNPKSTRPILAPRSLTSKIPGNLSRSATDKVPGISIESVTYNESDESPRSTTQNTPGFLSRSITSNSSGFFPSCRFGGKQSQPRISRHHAEPPPVAYKFFHRETRDSLFSDLHTQSPNLRITGDLDETKNRREDEVTVGYSSFHKNGRSAFKQSKNVSSGGTLNVKKYWLRQKTEN